MTKQQLLRLIQWGPATSGRIQRLACAVQAAGCPLGLSFDLLHLGVWSDELNQMLDSLASAGALNVTFDGTHHTYSLSGHGQQRLIESGSHIAVEELTPYRGLIEWLVRLSTPLLTMATAMLWQRSKGTPADDARTAVANFFHEASRDDPDGRSAAAVADCILGYRGSGRLLPIEELVRPRPTIEETTRMLLGRMPPGRSSMADVLTPAVRRYRAKWDPPDDVSTVESGQEHQAAEPRPDVGALETSISRGCAVGEVLLAAGRGRSTSALPPEQLAPYVAFIECEALVMLALARVDRTAIETARDRLTEMSLKRDVRASGTFSAAQSDYLMDRLEAMADHLLRQSQALRRQESPDVEARTNIPTPPDAADRLGGS